MALRDEIKREDFSAQSTTQFLTEQEMELVEKSFQTQKKLSFSYGAVFFLVTLLIPFLSGTAEWWYGKPLLAGLSLNFWTTLLLFYIFFWTLAYFFVKRANKLDEQIKNNQF